MKELDYNKINANKVRNEMMFRGCYHRDNNCSGKTSKAHSIQRGKILKSISDNGAVLCIDFGDFELESDKLLKRMSIKKASTFTGFCNYHDRNIFSPIENYDYNLDNAEQNFIFAYRACALAYYERKSSFGMIKEDLQRHLLADCLDAELYFKAYTYNKHIEVLESYKVKINGYLDNKQYDKIKTNVLVWDKEYGITATSMFYVLKDLEGNMVNSLKSSVEDLAPFFFTLFPQNGKTYVLMSYFENDKDKYNFIEKQLLGANEHIQKTAVTHILALYIENYCISPIWWDKIDKKVRDEYLDVQIEYMGGDKCSLQYYENLNIFVN